MFGMEPEQFKKALEEIERLNANLENLHKDAGEMQGMRSDLRALIGTMKDNVERLKALPLVAKHLAIFNQILLQTKKTAGTVGVVQTLIEGVIKATRR